MVTWVPLPEASGAREARTWADAVPAPRVSLPEASTTTTRASGSRSVNFAVPRYVSETGPTLTLTLPLTTSPSNSSQVAPGMHGAIRVTSSRTSQAWSGGTGTVKELSSSMAIGESLLSSLGSVNYARFGQPRQRRGRPLKAPKANELGLPPRQDVVKAQVHDPRRR